MFKTRAVHVPGTEGVKNVLNNDVMAKQKELLHWITMGR